MGRRGEGCAPRLGQIRLPRWHHAGVARRRAPTPDPPEEPSLKVTKARANDLINRAMGEGRDLLDAASSITREEELNEWLEARERWEARTKAALDSVFRGPWPTDFVRKASHIYRVVSQDPGETLEYGQDATRDAVNELQSLDERLEFLDEPVGQPNPYAAPGQVPDEPRRARGGSEVFVVHGHDLALRDRVARLIQRLGLTPVILEEQSSGGLTIIEKFERHAGVVGFAVVLLTPDDVGAAAGQPVPDKANRARQNVVLELGYFMGKLGRSHVAALCTEAVERPSDIDGLVYIDPDREDWQFRLAKEIKDAGLPVNLNDL